jgi:RNA recognition motif-containing protein
MEEDGWTDGPATRAETLKADGLVGDEDAELRTLVSARDAAGDFAAHVALIAALRARGLAGALRQARHAAAANVPLPPAMYRQWIVDEAQSRDLAGDRELVRVCETALADFQDVPIWETYLQIRSGASPCEDGESEDEDSDDADSEDEGDNDDESRALFERAIAAMGVHYSLGHRLFKQYRGFERSRPARAKGGGGDKVASLYRRQCGTPTKFAEEAMEALRGCDRAAAAEAEASHEAALKLRRTVEAYEAKVASQAAAVAHAAGEDLQRASESLAETWAAYAAWAQGVGEVPLAVCVLERAVASTRSSQPLWAAYLNLAASLKDAPLEAAVAARAARNCPQVLAFYEAQMAALEKSGCGPEEMDALKEAALRAATLGPRDHCQIFLAHAAFCRRGLSAAWHEAPAAQEDVVAWVQQLRASLGFGLAFMEATSDLSRLQLFQFYAAVEEDLIGDISGAAVSAEARAVWEACVGASPAEAASWQLFAAFEHRCGAPASERAVYRRAINAVPNDSPSWAGLCDEWLLMERLRGSIADSEDAARRVAVAQAELLKKVAARERRTREAAEDAAGSAAAVDPPRAAKKRAAESSHAEAPAVAVAKRARAAQEPSALPPPPQVPSEEGGPSGIFVTNLPFDVTDESLRALFAASAEPVVEVLRRANKAGRFRGMATVEFGSAAAARRALGRVGGTATLGDRTLQLSLATGLAPLVPKPKAAAAPSHPTTVFVAGLGPTVTDEELEALFAGCGAVAMARVLLVKGTRESRGEGLVQFLDPNSVPAALATAKSGLSVERSRFPAALPQSKKPAANPYLAGAAGAAPKGEAPPAMTSGPSKFSFVPRALRKTGDAPGK